MAAETKHTVNRWCAARGCNYKPVDGWIHVQRSGRRHVYCPEHDVASDVAHKTYKALEKNHALKTFGNDDIKKAIVLREKWPLLYTSKDESYDGAHPSFVRLLQQLLTVPVDKREKLFDKLLIGFMKNMARR